MFKKNRTIHAFTCVFFVTKIVYLTQSCSIACEKNVVIDKNPCAHQKMSKRAHPIMMFTRPWHHCRKGGNYFLFFLLNACENVLAIVQFLLQAE